MNKAKNPKTPKITAISAKTAIKALLSLDPNLAEAFARLVMAVEQGNDDALTLLLQGEKLSDLEPLFDACGWRLIKHDVVEDLCDESQTYSTPNGKIRLYLSNDDDVMRISGIFVSKSEKMNNAKNPKTPKITAISAKSAKSAKSAIKALLSLDPNLAEVFDRLAMIADNQPQAQSITLLEVIKRGLIVMVVEQDYDDFKNENVNDDILSRLLQGEKLSDLEPLFDACGWQLKEENDSGDDENHKRHYFTNVYAIKDRIIFVNFARENQDDDESKNVNDLIYEHCVTDVTITQMNYDDYVDITLTTLASQEVAK